MAYHPPTHIAAANISVSPPDYPWDEQVEEEVLFHQPRIAHRIGDMSHRAALAFSLGAIEWTLWRLHRELPDEQPFQWLEAAWAGIVDWKYLASFDLPEWEEDFDWPVGGPLGESFSCLYECFGEARRGKPFIHQPVTISEVALRVCGQPETFKTWRRTIIERLMQTCPMDLQSPLGRPVPRDIVDPDYIPSVESDQERIAAYIASLNWQSNPFLGKP